MATLSPNSAAPAVTAVTAAGDDGGIAVAAQSIDPRQAWTDADRMFAIHFLAA